MSGDRSQVNIDPFNPPIGPAGPQGNQGLPGIQGPPGKSGTLPFTNISPSAPYYPIIRDIYITSNDATHSTITAIVDNVTKAADIHADLTDISSDKTIYNANPTSSSPDDITNLNWSLPNHNTVSWVVTYDDIANRNAVITTFWVYNPVNNMQYYTQRVFLKKSKFEWYPR